MKVYPGERGRLYSLLWSRSLSPHWFLPERNSEGSKIAEGTPDEVRNDKEVIRAYLETTAR